MLLSALLLLLLLIRLVLCVMCHDVYFHCRTDHEEQNRSQIGENTHTRWDLLKRRDLCSLLLNNEYVLSVVFAYCQKDI